MTGIVLELKKIDAIYQESVRKPVAEIAEFLQEHFGQKITAYITGLKHTKEVGQWIAGDAEPRDLTKTRLRHAYQAARMLIEAYGSDTAKAWFFGTNTRLNNEAPAYVFRYAKTFDDMRFVVPAAQAFVGALE